MAKDPYERIRPGMKVVDLAGHIEVDYRDLALHVPLSEVNEVRDDAVVLAVDREAIDTQRWNLAPSAGSS